MIATGHPGLQTERSFLISCPWSQHHIALNVANGLSGNTLDELQKLVHVPVGCRYLAVLAHVVLLCATKSVTCYLLSVHQYLGPIEGIPSFPEAVQPSVVSLPSTLLLDDFRALVKHAP